MSGDTPPPFLIKTLDGDEWSASRPGSFTPKQTVTTTLWIGGWGGTRAGLNAMG
jgi:hypothetical protein